MHPTHGTTSIPVLARVVVLSLALACGLGAAVPAAAAAPRGDTERPTWTAPLTHLRELLARWIGGTPARLTGYDETDGGPHMDSDGLGGSGDDGPGMDPNGLGADGDDGPGMDPNG